MSLKENIKDYLVSIIIPTYNSERTIEQCLKSIEEQSYKNTEIIIVDSYSTDRTVDIVKNFNTKIIQTDWKLLGARYLGLKESNGNIIMLLDSDQILNDTTIKECINIFNNNKYDMLCLEEHTYKPTTWIQKLFEADRELIHKFPNIHLDPLKGVLLARVYKKNILERAFRNIPYQLYPIVVAHDHAIIYYESYILSKKVGILPNGVWHIEPENLWILLKKNYRYGKSTYALIESGYYQELLKKKIRFRQGALKDWKLGIQTYLLLVLKGMGYYTGYLSEKVHFMLNQKTTI